MIDRTKIIKGLEYHLKKLSVGKTCFECPYWGDNPCEIQLIADALILLKEQKAERSDWVSVEERMPVELHSIFWPWYGKKKWNNAMWREQSDKVLVTVAFKDRTRFVTTGETHDGVWHTTISRTLDPIVTHWMPMPEPPENGVNRNE